MKVPTKAELYAEIAALRKENAKLREILDAEKQKRWQTFKDEAFELFYESIPFSKQELRLVTLEHIDDVGYWFTYKLRVDNLKQTYCVRHTDIKE